MAKQVFRQESVDRISSPDELHDYLRVTSPRLWMLLSVVLVLVAGFIVFACVVTMENKIQVKARVDNEQDGGPLRSSVVIPLDLAQSGAVKSGMEVNIAGRTVNIIAVYENNGEHGALAELIGEEVVLPSGIYDAEIVLEEIHPISFLLN